MLTSQYLHSRSNEHPVSHSDRADTKVVTSIWMSERSFEEATDLLEEDAIGSNASACAHCDVKSELRQDVNASK